MNNIYLNINIWCFEYVEDEISLSEKIEFT